MKIRSRVQALCCAILALCVASLSASAAPGTSGREPGGDLLPVFARAHAGLPLRAAAIGGSITQTGKGWVEDWLRTQFPTSAVTMHNAGMSATGSALGIFRVERDVISAQPDLVFIEYAVNDGSLSDEDAVRFVESIVVRLKSLPNPPAIVFLEAAAKGGSKRERHQHVAAHYGLLDIDLQVALDTHLAETGTAWDVLMGDSVHPNAAGHAFYSEAIASALAPYVEAARKADAKAVAKPLPAPLSAKPLLLDGRIVPLDPQPGWRKENSLPHWWNMFFNGVISAGTVGTPLTLPVRGTTVGLFYALEKDTYGSFYVNVDGDEPRLVECFTRGGYSYTLLGQDLSAEQHLVRVAVANSVARDAGPVKLGYLLVAGETGAADTLAPQGAFDPAEVATRTFAPIPATAWEWSGPYGGDVKTTGPTADLETVFAPEDPQQAATAVWQAVPLNAEADAAKAKKDDAASATVDFGALTGRTDRGVCYARTTIQRGAAEALLVALRLDYFGKLWINGQLIRTIDGGHGGPATPMLIPVTLKEGPNTILLKVHSGSAGNQFSLFLQTN